MYLCFFSAQDPDSRLCRKSSQTELFHTLLTEFFHSSILSKGNWIWDYFPLGLIRLNETTGTLGLGSTVDLQPVSVLLDMVVVIENESRSEAGPYYGKIQSGGKKRLLTYSVPDAYKTI